MKVAIAHDYLTQRGGAERVVLEMLRVFPGSPVYTSLYEPRTTFPEFAELDIRTGPLNRLKAFRRDHRLALPLLAPATSWCRIDDVDAVVASSSGWAHGIRTDAPKVVYCYNPARWLYQRDEYLGDSPSLAQSLGLSMLTPALRAWDARAASGAARYVTTSTVVRERIRARYGIDAEVIPPPAGVTADGPAEQPDDALEPGFFLVVSRLLPYKNVDVVVAALSTLSNERLVVVGDGPERDRLLATRPPNVLMLRNLADPQLRWLYQHCTAVIGASHEDFGLTPLEGLAFGKPSVVLRAGGYVDTVLDAETGLFFDDVDTDAVAAAVRAAAAIEWDHDVLRRQHARFSRDVFAERLRAVVERAVASQDRP